MTNNEVKYYEKLKQKKYRDLENKFLIEGIHLIEECLKSGSSGNKIEKIFIRNDFENDSINKILRDHNYNKALVRLEKKTFRKLSETVNSQGIIGAVNMTFPDFKIDFSKSELVVVALDSINDPGNLGTIIRTCHWFGVNEILISKNSADIYNSKTIRASQGALFSQKIRNELDLKSVLEEYHQNGLKIFLSVVNSECSLDVIKKYANGNMVIVFGNEANGISSNIINCERYDSFTIKGFSQCESLNVSVAAGIALNKIRNG